VNDHCQEINLDNEAEPMLGSRHIFCGQSI
jgi:hypothetical protein